MEQFHGTVSWNSNLYKCLIDKCVCKFEKIMDKQFFVDNLHQKFHIRNVDKNGLGTLYVIYSLGDFRIKLSLRIKIYVEQWNKRLNRAYISEVLTPLDNMNNNIVNQKILRQQNVFERLKLYLCENPESIKCIEFVLKKFFYNDMKVSKKLPPVLQMRRYVRESNNLKESSKERYNEGINVFEDYLMTNNIKLNVFEDLDYNVFVNYIDYLFNRRTLAGTTLAINTIRDRINQLRIILRGCEYLNDKILHYKLPKKKGDNVQVYLDENEIRRIYDLNLSGKEERVRDVFVLQCWTGQRYSDMCNFRRESLKIEDSGIRIKLIQSKTEKLVEIPVFNELAINILKKYNFQIDFLEKSSSLATQVLKIIAKKAKIVDVILKNVQRKGGNVIERKYKYEMIGTHTARRSYITNMLKKGYTKEDLVKITGHSNGSSFDVYDKQTSHDVTEKILSKESNKATSTTNNADNMIREVVELAQKNVLLTQENKQIEQEYVDIKRKLDIITFDSICEELAMEIPSENDFIGKTTDGEWITDEEVKKQRKEKKKI